MPPYPLWVHGVEAVRTWLGTLSDACRTGRFMPVAANGSPGLAFYRPAHAGGPYNAAAIQVIEQSAGRIIGIHSFFDARLFDLFGVPPTLPR